MRYAGYYASLVARQSRGLIANDADPVEPFGLRNGDWPPEHSSVSQAAV
jgi:hypothetical protein